jgi:signal transduction histidine kinase/CheY-like chemotaxis protein
LWRQVVVENRTFQIISCPIDNVQIGPQSSEVDQKDTVKDDESGWVMVIRDVTREYKVAQRLQHQQRLAAIEQLAGGIAHGFNNILTAIKGYTEFALDRLDPDTLCYGDLQEVRKGTDRAACLTNQLLTFSRKQVLRSRLLDLNGVILNLEERLQRLIGKEIRISYMLSVDPNRVIADPEQIEQAILNLVLNARDAMPHGGHLTIETKTVLLDKAYGHLYPGVTPGTYASLSVSDTGTGMTEEVKSHLFEPFFTTKEVGEGTGLGLSTVHGIVAQSGGHIEVESEIGRGTTFTIYLPTTSGDSERYKSVPSCWTTSFGTETVLVVEDTAAVQRLICRALERHDYQVLTAEQPKEALCLGMQHPGAIHLLITNLLAPEMRESDLVRRLVDARPEMRVLYTSTYGEDVMNRWGVRVPHVSFLAKPFTPAALANKVCQVLARDE